MKGMKFDQKPVPYTMNYLLYGPIALTGTRPLTRPFIQRTKGGQMENVSCFYSYTAFQRDRNNELNAHYMEQCRACMDCMIKLHRKKRFASFPSTAGMSLPNSPWAGIMTS
jgi:hypothetical protein